MASGRLTPFLITGGPVPPEEVVDRESFIEGALRRLRDGHSLYISGARRTGKSSVAGALLDRFRRDGYYTAYLDLFAIPDELTLAQRLAGAVLANRGPKRSLLRRPISLEPSLSARGFPPEFKVALGFKVGAPDPEPSVLLDRALELPEFISGQDKRGMVIAFDEFQEVEKLGGIEMLRRMRAHFQHQRSVAYVFLGSRGTRLRQMVGAAAEPFFRFAEPSRLPLRRAEPPTARPALELGHLSRGAIRRPRPDYLGRRAGRSPGRDGRAPGGHHAGREPHLLRGLRQPLGRDHQRPSPRRLRACPGRHRSVLHGDLGRTRARCSPGCSEPGRNRPALRGRPGVTVGRGTCDGNARRSRARPPPRPTPLVGRGADVR
jgi:hypothetical protein